MNLFPFFSALFLIVNPVLLGLFNRFNQNLQKLQFWVMLTSGMAWLISLVFFFFTPDHHLNPIWNAGETLLPSLAFSLDWVSSSYFLAVTTLIFFGILVEGHSPQTNAWITGLGGICVIGTLVDSAYTLAMVWTLIEASALYSFLKNQGEMTTSHRYIFSILARLSGPLLVIYISLVNSSAGIAPFLTELPPSAAPILMAAGVIGFAGWFLTPKISQDVRSVIHPGNYLTWTPAVLGLVLITRSAQILEGDPVFPRSDIGWDDPDLYISFIKCYFQSARQGLESWGLGSDIFRFRIRCTRSCLDLGYGIPDAWSCFVQEFWI